VAAGGPADAVGVGALGEGVAGVARVAAGIDQGFGEELAVGLPGHGFAGV